MILVDTSIWIEHLRSGSRRLTRLLESGAVLGHAWVTGELALGNLANRAEVLTLLQELPQATVATDAEILKLIEVERLYGEGIGFVDAQLLAASRLTPDARLWSGDRRLDRMAARLGLAFDRAAHERELSGSLLEARSVKRTRRGAPRERPASVRAGRQA